MASSPPLDGTWVVDRLRGADGSLAAPVPGTRVELRFEDGAVTGTTGCNSYRGWYRTDGRSIEIDPPATTRRFCLRPPGVMEQEERFLTAITAAATFAVEDDGTLVLSDETGAPLAKMTPKATDGN